MVYLVCHHFSRSNDVQYREFMVALDKLKATATIQRFVWILESEDTATALYLQLAPLLPDLSTDKLIVAEITTNTIGTFIATGHQDAKSLELARLIGSARQ